MTRRPDELNRLVELEHALCCQLGLSRRKIQRRLLISHGIRRSVGAISRDLARFECDKCAPQPEPVPVKPAVYSWSAW